MIGEGGGQTIRGDKRKNAMSQCCGTRDVCVIFRAALSAELSASRAFRSLSAAIPSSHSPLS